MLAEEAPKITDWMQAWGSLAGLVMSTVAVLFTGLLFRHEIRVRREEQRDNEAAQARLVVGIIAEWEPSEVNEWGDLVGPAVSLTWQVKNYSQAPVFDVRISFYANWGHDFGVVRFSNKKPVAVAVIEESASGQVGITPTEIRDEEGFDLSRFTVSVEFTDASGVRWKRFGNYPPERRFDFHPPTEAEGRRSRRQQRIAPVLWQIGRWKLWAQVKVLKTRPLEDLEAYGTEYDPIPF
ncbi:hypothetical protein ACFWC6_33780 [Micromonospora chalcea]